MVACVADALNLLYTNGLNECLGRLHPATLATQMAAIKKSFHLLLISSISRPSLFCFGFDLNQSRARPEQRYRQKSNKQSFIKLVRVTWKPSMQFVSW